MNTTTKPLHTRGWQHEARDTMLEAHRDRNLRAGLIDAVPGAGKTAAGLVIYEAGAKLGLFDLAIVVTPKSGIRASWGIDGERLGMAVHVIRDGETIPDDLPRTRTEMRRQRRVLVANIQMLQGGLGQAFASLCKRFRVLVLLDEAHHLGEGLVWANNALHAFDRAAFRLGLSGTPERTDKKALALMRSTTGEQVLQYTYIEAQALADGFIAPVATRFVGGRVDEIYPSGRGVPHDFADGDYSQTWGSPSSSSPVIAGGDDDDSGPNLGRMNKRLKVCAIACYEWQMQAIEQARVDLMRYREDGRPWGGLVFAHTIEQAKHLQQLMAERWPGDKTMLLVEDADTESHVALFNADLSYDWVISITKISEGVSIKRLRVGVLLSNVTSNTWFQQARGRFMRLYESVDRLHPSEQTATFIVPADPRHIEHALRSHTGLLERVSWLAQPHGSSGMDGTGAANVHDVNHRSDEERELQAGMQARAQTEQAAQAIAQLRTVFASPAAELTHNTELIEFRLEGTVINGRRFDNEKAIEEEKLRLRASIIIDPRTADVMPYAQLLAIMRPVDQRSASRSRGAA